MPAMMPMVESTTWRTGSFANATASASDSPLLISPIPALPLRRTLPGLLRRTRRAQRQRALLAEMQSGPARRAAAQLDGHQRHARLIQKRRDRPPHWLAARRSERIQKVARRRVAPRVLAHVPLHAAPEGILAHPVLEH